MIMNMLIRPLPSLLQLPVLLLHRLLPSSQASSLIPPALTPSLPASAQAFALALLSLASEPSFNSSQYPECPSLPLHLGNGHAFFSA